MTDDNDSNIIVEGDFTVEYFFIEKADEQIKPINDDQGYQMAFVNIYIGGKFDTDNLKDFSWVN